MFQLVITMSSSFLVSLSFIACHIAIAIPESVLNNAGI